MHYLVKAFYNSSKLVSSLVLLLKYFWINLLVFKHLLELNIFVVVASVIMFPLRLISCYLNYYRVFILFYFSTLISMLFFSGHF